MYQNYNLLPENLETYKSNALIIGLMVMALGETCGNNKGGYH
jgi:hypothetical protein